MSHVQEITYFDVGDVIRVSNAEDAAHELAAQLAEEDLAIEHLRHELGAEVGRLAESEAALADYVKLTPDQVRAIVKSLS